jgi:apolipoprotein N-acyltransferase
MDTTEQGFRPLNWRRPVLLALVSVACFHAAYTPAKSGLLAFGIIGYLICLVQLARLRTTRQCFYSGLAVGFACFAPQLECFWRIFGPGAIALWLVLAFWIALFLVLAHLALARLGLKWGALLIPFLWTGLEYFRSELYYLKFSWMNSGYAFSEGNRLVFHSFGMFGIGFSAAIFAALLLLVRPANAILLSPFLFFFFCLTVPIGGASPGKQLIQIAGVQLEFPNENQIFHALDKVVATRTNLNLIVLSEYTLGGPPSERLKVWCRTNHKFLIVGGKDPAPGNNYYNTAFVIGTKGEIVFKQVKSVPIQFFKDGLPASEQTVWKSPWGKIGICICYDLSYARVTDELVRQGAQMLIVPTMDVADWGRHQHELHARVAPVRAAEYGIPIFRVASSGISQGVNWRGGVQSSAPFEGQGEILFFGAHLSPGLKAPLPLDRWLAPFCVGVTGLFVTWLAGESFWRWRRMKSQGNIT